MDKDYKATAKQLLADLTECYNTLKQLADAAVETLPLVSFQQERTDLVRALARTVLIIPRLVISRPTLYEEVHAVAKELRRGQATPPIPPVTEEVKVPEAEDKPAPFANAIEKLTREVERIKQEFKDIKAAARNADSAKKGRRPRKGS